MASNQTRGPWTCGLVADARSAHGQENVSETVLGRGLKALHKRRFVNATDEFHCSSTLGSRSDQSLGFQSSELYRFPFVPETVCSATQAVQRGRTSGSRRVDLPVI